MVHQQQMNKLLLEEKERLIEHLQKELLEIKLERDKLQQLLEKQRVEELQWSESKVVSKGASVLTVPVQVSATTRIPPMASFTRITSTACTVGIYMKRAVIAVI